MTTLSKSQSALDSINDLLSQLTQLNDVERGVSLLAEHRERLDEDFAARLKHDADQFLRTDIDQSRKMVRWLYALAELLDNRCIEALALRADGNVRAIGLAEYAEAIELYNRAAAIYTHQGDPLRAAKSQVGAVGALAFLGQYGEAFAVGTQIRKVLETYGEWETLATVTMNLAIIHGRRGEDVKALALFEEAGNLYRRLGTDESETGWLWTEQNRAVSLRNLGRFDEAIEASQIAWQTLEKRAQVIEAARARQNLAMTYYVLGRFNEALDHLDHVGTVFWADGRERDAMLVELFISDCLLQLRRFNDVLEKCARVRLLFSTIGDRQVVAQAIVKEAVAYSQTGRYQEALVALAEAQHIYETQKNEVGKANVALEIASIHGHQANFSLARKIALSCVDIYDKYELPVERAHAYLLAAKASIELNDFGRAEAIIDDTLSFGEASNLPAVIYRSCEQKGRLFRTRNELREALLHFDAAISQLERIRRHAMVEFQVDFLGDKDSLYESAVDTCLELDLPDEGLKYAERAKSRVLQEMISHRVRLALTARNAEDQVLVDQLLILRDRRDQLYRRFEVNEEMRLRGRSGGGKPNINDDQTIGDIEKEIEKLWHRLQIRNADYAQDAARWHVRTEAAQQYLDDETLLLEYFEVDGHFVLFCVDASQVWATRLKVSSHQVARLIQALDANLRIVIHALDAHLEGLCHNAQGLLNQLYSHLVAPVGERLDNYRQLIVVPHGVLHYLPFHALHHDQQYLVEKLEIAYLPGSSLLNYCQDPYRGGCEVATFGHSNRGTLPHAPEEAQIVGDLFKGNVYLEEKATLDRLRSLRDHHQIVHLATHGEFRSDNPLFSGLSFEDGWLTTLDIFNLTIEASLVTLSACQTGRSVIGGGDELNGLMRAFLVAGAKTLLLGLWSVEDQSTARFMKSFYTGLAARQTKSQALRIAQLQFIQDHNAVYTHPYFWAPFFLVGHAGGLT